MSTYVDPATALRIAHEARAAQLRDAESSRRARASRRMPGAARGTHVG